MFEKVKKYFERGFYTAEQVAEFVRKGRITKEQYKEITGDDFE